MTWTKLSDDFPDDCDTLSDAAFRLHVEGLAWSNRKLLDVHIPKAQLRKFATNPDAVDELVTAGFWAEGEGEGEDEYVIRHHARYQRTREAVIRQQSVLAENGRKGGLAKAKAIREQVRDVTAPPSKLVSKSSSKPGETADGTPAADWTGRTPANSTIPGKLLSKALSESSSKGDRPGSIRESSFEPGTEAEEMFDLGTGEVRPNTKARDLFIVPAVVEPGHTGTALDPDAWPTDDKGVAYRLEIEEKNLHSVQALMKYQPMKLTQAQNIWDMAYPGRAVR